MLRTYVVDGKQVTVTWVPQHHPPVYTILIQGVEARGSVEKTPAGRFLALDRGGHPLGTFTGLRLAVERVAREEPPRG